MNSLSLLFSLFTALPPVTYLHVCMHVFLHITLLSIELTISQFMRLWGQLTHTTTYHSWLNLARLCVSFFFQSSKIKVFIVTILKSLDEKSKITLILVFRAIRNTVPSFIRTTFLISSYFFLIFPSVFPNLRLLSVKGLMTGQWFLDPPAVLQPSSLGLLKHRNITHYDHSTHDFTSRCTDTYTQKTDLL